jgi:hypothetical protein
MRRRRRAREPVFGFDSFVDLITNLVGIVLRLIIVVLMGVHLKGGFSAVRGPSSVVRCENEAACSELEATGNGQRTTNILEPLIEDADDPETRRYETEIAALQGRLLEALRSLDVEKDAEQMLKKQRAATIERQKAASQLLARHDEAFATHRQSLVQTQKDVPLEKAVKQVEAKPLEKRPLRFHLPISRPVDAEELIFECRQGRVTFADVQALLEQVQQNLPHKAEELRTRWSLTETTEAVGAFQLRYTLERERGSSLNQLADLPPTERQFRYGLGKWELVPVWPVRGDLAAEALKDGSRFRTVVDALEPEQVVLTFFVYPDSFDLFRGLRDYLHERGFVVAGRPLPDGYPIFGSKTGSISRGQ